jgi:4-amino-4-deoxy-L-arabinose transferase-like glycosyltransferase
VAWLTRRTSAVFRLRYGLAFSVPLLLIAAPWFFLIVQRQPDFLEYFFWRHHVQRFVNAFNHSQPWWFYLPVVAVGMLPGSLLAPALAVYLGRKRLADARKRTPELGALLLAGAWVVGFFSLSSCKLPTYILPAFPCFALAFGKLLGDLNWNVQPALEGTEALLQNYVSRAARHTLVLTAVLIAAGAVVVLALDHLAIARGLLLIAAAAATVVVLVRERLQSLEHLATTAAAASVAGLVLGYGLVVPEVATWRSIAHTAAEVQQQRGINSPVVYWDHAAPAAGFDIPGQIVELSAAQTAELENLLEQEQQVVLVAHQAKLKKLKDTCRLTVHIEGPKARQRVYIASRLPTSR